MEMEMPVVKARASRFGALKSTGKSSSTSMSYEKSYSSKSGTLEEYQNSANYHGESKSIGGHRTSLRTEGRSSSLVSPTYGYSKIAVTNGGMSPTTTAKHITTVRYSVDKQMGGTLTDDMHATTMMSDLNNVLLRYKNEVEQLHIRNLKLTEDLKNMRGPLDAFARLEHAVQSITMTQKVEISSNEKQLISDYARCKAEGEVYRAKYEMLEKARREQMIKIDTLEKNRLALDNEIHRYHSQKAEFDDRYKRALSDNDLLAADLKRIRSEIEIERQMHARLEKQVAAMSAQSHEYTMVMQKLREQVLAFTATSHSEVIQTDLHLAIEKIREDYEMSRRSLERQFAQRVAQIEQQWKTDRAQNSKYRHEVESMNEYRSRLFNIEKQNHEYHARIATLHHDYEALRCQCDLLDEQYKYEKERWEKIFAFIQSSHLAVGNKSKLYGEVVVYRDIMEGKTEIIQQKERMHAFQNQSNGIDHGYVAISLVDSEGRFITLKNKTMTDITLRGYVIHQWKGREGSERGTASLTWHLPEITIHAGKKFQIFSRGEQPNDTKVPWIVSTETWCKGNVVTHLIDGDNKLQATYNRVHDSEDLEE